MTFELTILGSSSAIPTTERYPTAQVLNVSERFFLIDCGEGTQIQLRRMRINFAKINHIFISHLHGDHYFGLMGFISTRNLLGITGDLHLYAHSDLKELLQPQLDYMKNDLRYRIVFHPLNFKNSDTIYSDKKVEVISFPLKHSIPVCGFFFREKSALPNIRKEMIAKLQIPIAQIKTIKEGAGFTSPDGKYHPHEELTLRPATPRSYAFCTDTIPWEPAAELLQNIDLLYHEATFMADMEVFAAKTLHSTAQQAAQFAAKINARKLIIGHFSTRYKEVEPLLEEARCFFPETETAIDGRKFSIEH